MTSYGTICAPLALLVSLAGPAAAQQMGFRGPVSGFVYTSRSVRPLLGAPGSALAGPALIDGADWASIAPGGAWALITQADGSKLMRDLSGPPSAFSPDGLIQGIDRAAWSRDGSCALLYSSSAGQIQRVRFSGGEAFADAPVSLSAYGTVMALAIDARGQQMAFGTTGTDAAGLYLLAEGQNPMLLAPMARPAAAAFDETGKRLYAIDVETRRILEFDSGAGPNEFAILAELDAPAPDPAGLAVAGRYLLLADRAGPAVRVYDTVSQTPINTIGLDFAPSRMDALSDGPTFVLNGDRSDEWLMVLDARRTPTVYFVPATVEEQQ